MFFKESHTGLSRHTHQRMTLMLETISGVFYFREPYFIRHHVQPRVKLDLPKKESFPIPLKYVDVVRRTNRTLDALLESRIDDDWNVDGDQELSGPWTGFHPQN